ncbi:MAG: hypothetical protein A3G20_05140 [Acidobacteria bacterium RIFCSPLOWO2_12_FULL_59_11]|nr:MAG: hypothetical protein A3G20_05140 [Acidobacteria bacterium RIFCSPLOWO2_12_FULL_59_11]
MKNRGEDFQYNVALLGASTLKGKEVKALLEERGFPAGRFGLLGGTEPGEESAGPEEEPDVLQPVSRESFKDMSFAIFATSPAFATEHWQMAEESECEIIDLSYGLETLPQARLRAPMVECLLGSGPTPQALSESRISVVAHPAAMAIAGILGQLAQRFSIVRSAMTVYEPVSERGQEGVGELHRQTVGLLSFQEIPKRVFDSQVAFNLLASGSGHGRPTLPEVQNRIAHHVRELLQGRVPQPALRLLQAPIFFGYALCGFVELKEPASTEEIEKVLHRKPFAVSPDGENQPSVLEAAGSDEVALGLVERDPACAAGYWIWGVMDNVRLAALNAVEIAEEIVFLGSYRR